jgi:hypothetical protein
MPQYEEHAEFDCSALFAALAGMAKRGDVSCQHALFMLRSLERSPESFMQGARSVAVGALPAAGPDRRLRWNLQMTSRRQWERDAAKPARETHLYGRFLVQAHLMGANATLARLAAVVGWPGGIAPLGSLRSRRDSLPSPGSSDRPSVGADHLPVGE